ncbi:MAG: 30S ribosomal protein S6 [Bacteroidales bacterium]|jgi:small subunit ribosomal protein S6|nr:30S ribosomal protein S6 [Bacteroidales bacterium]MDD4214404.1 30S ribosomal protein S6 [Bacteroidales bacterium]
MTKHYETVFILTPVLSDDQVKEAVKKFLDFLKERKAEIIVSENWGLRKLAYPIQKKSSGFYHLIEFNGDTEIIAELEVTFKRDERIIRYLTVALDKHAVAYKERKRAEKQKKEKESV